MRRRQTTMVRILVRVLSAATTVAASVALAAVAPAGASCAGPTLRYSPVTADRGTTVTVTGEGWGDDCYDTGPPPAGEGVLGTPRTDIHLVWVQGDTEVEAATVDAGADYRFTAQVTVPAQLEPGPAIVEARVHEDGWVAVQSTSADGPTEITVSDAAPVTPATTTTTGPAEGTATTSSSSSSGWGWRWPLLAVGLVVAAGVGVAVVRLSRPRGA